MTNLVYVRRSTNNTFRPLMLYPVSQIKKDFKLITLYIKPQKEEAGFVDKDVDPGDLIFVIV